MELFDIPILKNTCLGPLGRNLQGKSWMCLWIYPISLKSGYGSDLRDREQELGSPLLLKRGKGS